VIRRQVEEIVAEEDETVAFRIGGDIASDLDLRPYVTPRARRVLELSSLEALRASAEHIGAEHILLGLIREGEGVAAQVLVRIGADVNRVRRHL
jgi:Clp amino terminal domain, pathogenicity island component